MVYQRLPGIVVSWIYSTREEELVHLPNDSFVFCSDRTISQITRAFSAHAAVLGVYRSTFENNTFFGSSCACSPLVFVILFTPSFLVQCCSRMDYRARSLVMFSSKPAVSAVCAWYNGQREATLERMNVRGRGVFFVSLHTRLTYDDSIK